MRQQQWPVVGIPCDVYQHGLHPHHGSGEKYINALAHGAGVRPILLPAVGRGQDLEPLDNICTVDEILGGLDGLFLTGNASNVDPHFYGETSSPGNSLDPQRDVTTLPLIRGAMERNIPLFAVCRGFQELNVALGGTLHQKVHEVQGMLDHREDTSLPRDGQYDYAHQIRLSEGGLLRDMMRVDEVRVNSVHGQGICRLADGLVVEATAPDGLIEAACAKDKRLFVLGVQFHPEWRYHLDPLYSALFKAFGDAIRTRM